MKFSAILICGAAIAVAAVSCKKDSGSNGPKGFEGTWTVAGIHSETRAENVYSQGGDDSKSITVSVYNGKNVTGTVKFAGGTATSTNLGYSVDTTATGYFYENDVFVDSTSEPFTFTAPPSSSTSGYKLVGADSVSFTGSGLVSGSPTSGAASGGHYSISDNKMTISTSVLKDSVVHDGDATLTIHETANVNIYLQK